MMADQFCGNGHVNSSYSGDACRSHNCSNTRLVLKGLLPLINSCVELQTWNYTSRVSGKKKGSNSAELQELALRGLIKHGVIRQTVLGVWLFQNVCCESMRKIVIDGKIFPHVYHPMHLLVTLHILQRGLSNYCIFRSSFVNPWAELGIG